MTEDDKNYAEVYEQRNETMQAVIDACAETEDLDQWGAKSSIADEVGVGDSYVHYVLDNWSELVEWRRNANRNPLDPDAVKQAYDDEAMQAMAGQGEVVTDGMGDVSVQVEFSLDEAFRVIKLLPGDLGMRVFTQILEDADQLPRSGLEALFDK